MHTVPKSVCTRLVSELAQLLRRFRETAGMTQEELAEHAGVSARTVSDTERGLRNRIYADTAGRLADALGVAGAQRDEFLNVAKGRRSRPGDRSMSDLPHPLTGLVGRAGEVASLVADLDPDSGRRLVTVTGLGGIGKTRVAIAAADRLRAGYRGRVRFVPLAATDPDRLVEAVADGLSTVAARIPTVTADLPTLVVLDAFEHVLPAVDQLADLVQRAPDLRVLVTSRVRLGISGERECPLGPLSAQDAARLLRERLHDVGADTGADIDADENLIVDICRLASALPLPLELAAAQARYLPLDVLRDRLRAGLSDAGRVVHDAVAWSMASLSTDERAVLSGIALFPGGCHLEALQAVCASIDVVPPLGALVDKHLVVLDRTMPAARWWMLDAVREATQASDAGAAGTDPADERWPRYLAYYLDFLQEAQQQVGNEEAWYRRLAVEEANVRSALAWAEQRRDAALLLRLATGMWQFWQARGGLDEGRHWLARGLAMEPAAPAEAQMTALWGMGWLAYHQADDNAAAAAADRLASLAGDTGDSLPRRNAMTITAMVEIARDRPREAITLLTEALRIARALDHPWILATSMLNLALAHLADSSPDRARTLLAHAVQHYERIGDRRFQNRCIGYLGLASLIDGEPQRARALFLQAFLAFRDIGEPAGTAEGLAGLAAVEAATGDPNRAAVLGGAAERIRDTAAARELPLERRIAARYLGAAEARVGAEAWAHAWWQGRQLDPDDVSAELGLARPAES